MTSLVHQPNIPMALDPVRVGQIFAQSRLFPDTTSEAQCATKLIVGPGMGLTPYDSMSGLHIIQGKVVLAANLMSAAIKRNPKYDYRAKTTKDACTITFYDISAGKPEKIGETTFDMDDAKQAGLGGTNWKKYPKAMLFARCISAGYREHCPDALGNGPVYVEAHGETELGVTIEDHNAEVAALPSAPIVEEVVVESTPAPKKKVAAKKPAPKKPEPTGDVDPEKGEKAERDATGTTMHVIIQSIEEVGSGDNWTRYQVTTAQDDWFSTFSNKDEYEQCELAINDFGGRAVLEFHVDPKYPKSKKVTDGGIKAAWPSEVEAEMGSADEPAPLVEEEMPF